MAFSASPLVNFVGHPVSLNHDWIDTSAPAFDVPGAIDTTGVKLLVITVSWYIGGGTAMVVTDSKSNTWTGLTGVTNGNVRQRIFYCLNPTVGSGHTFRVELAGSYPAMTLTGWSASSPSYDSQQSSGTAGSGTTVQPGSVTPSMNGALVLTSTTHDASTTTTPSINASFTVSDSRTWVFNDNMPIASVYLVQGTAGAVNPTWTLGASVSNLLSLVAVFTDAGGAGGSFPSLIVTA